MRVTTSYFRYLLLIGSAITLLVVACKKVPNAPVSAGPQIVAAPSATPAAGEKDTAMQAKPPLVTTKRLTLLYSPQLKLRHPAQGLVTSPEKPDAARDRLRREFDGISPNDPKFYEILKRLWDEFALSSFNQHLQSSGVAGVASGAFLPTEIKDGTWPFTNGAENEAVHILELLARLDGVQGANHLPSLLESRANELPPTDEDLAFYYAASAGIDEMNPSENMPYLDLWLPLASSKNPVYRLLALEAGLRATAPAAESISPENPQYNIAEAPAKLAFFKPFLEEQDPAILAEAVRAIGTVGSPDARATLESFRDQQQRAGQSDLVDQADQALQTCNALLLAAKRK